MNATGPRVLVAGIGNIFLGDDGFGVEVARRLQAPGAAPDGVRVMDIGIRGIHLAYELLDTRYDTTVLVDAVARGGEPGTLYVLEPGAAYEAASVPDGHRMDPAQVLHLLDRIGGAPGRVLIVGCEPDRVEEEMGLSPAVAAAVPDAVDMVLKICASPYPH